MKILIKNIINFFNNLRYGFSVWHENYKTLEKEKIYKGRKIILLVKKTNNQWEGNILVITYSKRINIVNDSIIWENKPDKMYKAKISMFKDISVSTKEIQKTMDNLFSFYFLEKKEKLKFKK
jgi:hypothetical protein